MPHEAHEAWSAPYFAEVFLLLAKRVFCPFQNIKRKLTTKNFYWRAFCKTPADRFFGLSPKFCLFRKLPTISSMRVCEKGKISAKSRKNRFCWSFARGSYFLKISSCEAAPLRVSSFLRALRVHFIQSFCMICVHKNFFMLFPWCSRRCFLPKHPPCEHAQIKW